MDKSYTDSDKSSRACALDRPFIIARYLGSGDQRQPEIPDRCPVDLAAPARSHKRICAVRIDHYRVRKTGPEFPLAVCLCTTHGVGFTIYPAGFGPYMRQPADRMEPSGELPDAVPTADVAATDRVRWEFEGTIFEAALAAADGEAWARDSIPGAGADLPSMPDRWWSFQLRRIRLGLEVLGLAPGMKDVPRVRIGEVLQIATTRLLELGKTLHGYRAGGQAIRSVLSRLVRGPSRALDLLTCCHLAGRFGRPMPWCAARGFLPREAFPSLALTGGL